jgi:hypothetical protein
MWQDVRKVDHNPGNWPVRPLRERPRWQWLSWAPSSREAHEN